MGMSGERFGPILHKARNPETHVGTYHGLGPALCHAGAAHRTERGQAVVHNDALVTCRTCLRRLGRLRIVPVKRFGRTAMQVMTIQDAVKRIREARDLLRSAGAEKAADYVARALKSVEGAERNALRFLSRG